MNDNPAVVTEVSFTVQARTRDAGIELADKTANAILEYTGGEPWLMIDDDWKRVRPDERWTLIDDQGFMYVGARRYLFSGPLTSSSEVPQRDGWRVQGVSDAYED